MSKKQELDLVERLERIREVIAASPIDCLGSAHDPETGPAWPIRDEVVDGLSRCIEAAAALRATGEGECIDPNSASFKEGDDFFLILGTDNRAAIFPPKPVNPMDPPAPAQVDEAAVERAARGIHAARSLEQWDKEHPATRRAYRFDALNALTAAAKEKE